MSQYRHVQFFKLWVPDIVPLVARQITISEINYFGKEFLRLHNLTAP